MAEPLATVAEVIDALGGARSMAMLLRVSQAYVYNMKTAGQIPIAHAKVILDALGPAQEVNPNVFHVRGKFTR